VRSIVKYNERLAPYTTWHVGGVADRYYRPIDIENLIKFLREIPKEMPVIWLGLGSNVLISDEGLRGAVIHCLSSSTHKPLVGQEAIQLSFFPGLKKLSHTTEIIRAEALVPAAKLAKFCLKTGLVGGEFFAGIPGTIGGALAMNAGAWGSDTWQHVLGVEVVNRRGERRFCRREEYEVGYRRVVSLALEEEWFLAGYFQFEQGDAKAAQDKIKALLQLRNQQQPIGVFSGGSVFMNPYPQYAGQLIEASNLKGYSIGDAEVSTKHANFILNRGKASAQDIYQLIKYVQSVVKATHNIDLKIEVKMLGVFDE
jgi:UDP-N-acetylmuramate dehydrogenase